MGRVGGRGVQPERQGAAGRAGGRRAVVARAAWPSERGPPSQVPPQTCSSLGDPCPGTPAPSAWGLLLAALMTRSALTPALLIPGLSTEPLGIGQTGREGCLT